MFDKKLLILILDSCRYDTFVQAKTPNFDKVGKVMPALTRSNHTSGSFGSFFMTFHFPAVDDYELNRKVRQFLIYYCRKKKLRLWSGMPLFFPSWGGVHKLDVLDELKFNNKSHCAMDFVKPEKFFDKFKIEVVWAGETHWPFEVNTGDTEFNQEDHIKYRQGKYKFPQEHLDYLKSRQVDMIEYCDKRFGEWKIPKDTMVIITADHGEAFGEQGYFGHGHGFIREMFEVPLVVRGIEDQYSKLSKFMPSVLWK